MRNRGGIARLVIAALCSLTMILYSSYHYLFGANTAVSASAFLPASDSSGAPEEETSTGDADNRDDEKPAASATQSSAPESSGDSSAAVQAATSGTVKGKVIERFISPYTAGVSYDGIYLKNSTSLTIDLKALLTAALPYTVDKNDQPQVLIMHTHTTESFLRESRDYYTDSDESRTLDESYNMVHLGNIVADKLNNAGIKALHDTTTHDYPSYSGSYTRAAQTIQSYLKKYPGIKIVIDMHRDAMSSGESDKIKIATEIEGKKAAQIMLVMGSQSGNVSNFPNWEENLKLAVRLQQTLETMYPALARPISLMERNYNESLTTGSLLIETGTDANSIDEACYSAELLGNALVRLLNTLG